MMNEDPLEIWKQESEWFERNDLDPELRKEAFSKIFSYFPVSCKLLEVGCGTGYNLVTLRNLGFNKVVGVEPNLMAREIGMEKNHVPIVPGDCFYLIFGDNSFDVVFTAGVLMHVGGFKLAQAFSELLRVTNNYLLIIEYYNPVTEEIVHNGRYNFLWKRDYGKYMQDTTLIDGGFLGKDMGFDNAHWWLWRKLR